MYAMAVLIIGRENLEAILTGFGSFTVKERAARDGRNPATGEKMMIAASKIPAFKAGNIEN